MGRAEKPVAVSLSQSVRTQMLIGIIKTQGWSESYFQRPVLSATWSLPGLLLCNTGSFCICLRLLGGIINSCCYLTFGLIPPSLNCKLFDSFLFSQMCHIQYLKETFCSRYKYICWINDGETSWHGSSSGFPKPSFHSPDKPLLRLCSQVPLTSITVIIPSSRIFI